MYFFSFFGTGYSYVLITVPYIKQKFRLALYGEVGFGFSRESLRGLRV